MIHKWLFDSDSCFPISTLGPEGTRAEHGLARTEVYRVPLVFPLVFRDTEHDCFLHMDNNAEILAKSLQGSKVA
jgi:hypothetical protein